MARLRLFANLREAAGVGAADVSGSSVREVLGNAVGRFGDAFGAGLGSAQIWVNGDRADESTPVSEDDEIALIPPVSGGTTMVRSPVMMEIGLFLLLAIVLLIANAVSLQWYAVAVVLAGAVWAYDITDFAGRRGLLLSLVPVLAGILGGALATYRWGEAGMASATVGAVIVSLAWAVLVPRFRSIESVSASAVLALMATFGSAALVLLRIRSEDETLAFLVVAGVAVLAAWLAGQREIAGFDPTVVTLLTGIIVGLAAASVWGGETILPMIVASLAAAVALVAGRSFGSMVRAGGFFVVGTVPGALHPFDAIVMAAGPFWLVVAAFG